MEKPIHYIIDPIVLVDGYTFSGTDLFIRELLPGYSEYKCPLDLSLKNSWILNYGAIDLLEQLNPKERIIINCGVASNYVYDRLYNNHILDANIINWYKNHDFFKNKIGHIYVRHHNADSAKMLFEAQTAEKIPDKFNTFNDYWLLYNYADQLYKEAYDHLEITPRIFETISDKEWREVT